MKKYAQLFAFMLFLTLCLAPAFSQEVDEDEPMGPECPQFHRMGIPDLTADQSKEIQKLTLENKKNLLHLRIKLQTQRLELQSLIMDEAGQGKIDQKIEEIGKIRTELMKNKVNHRVSIRKLLNDEQKVHFDMQGLKPHPMRKFHGFDKEKEFPGPGPHQKRGF